MEKRPGVCDVCVCVCVCVEIVVMVVRWWCVFGLIWFPSFVSFTGHAVLSFSRGRMVQYSHLDLVLKECFVR